MNHEVSAPIRVAGLLSLLGVGLGCDEPSRIGPPLTWITVLSVTYVTPNAGLINSPVSLQIGGTGFKYGASVSLDGQATDVMVISPVLITATAPPHAAATVDVVVTNPDGGSARLAGGFRYTPIEITRVQPDHALPGSRMRVIGTGFVAGTTLTVDGVAVSVGENYGTSIVFTAPAHAAGPVDLVVTNPEGKTAALAGGFTFDAVTLTLTPATVAVSAQLSGSWAAPASRTPWDSIGLFKVGMSNRSYAWLQSTGGTAAGTVAITAPAQPGDYELRYFVGDGSLVVAATSPPITVR